MPVPLATLPPGAKARIVAVAGGHGAIRRAMEAGLAPGTIVEVVDSLRGPIVLRVRGTIVAIGRGLAQKILVEPL
jgi:ferrous iron transport protein A